MFDFINGLLLTGNLENEVDWNNSTLGVAALDVVTKLRKNTEKNGGNDKERRNRDDQHRSEAYVEQEPTHVIFLYMRRTR